MADREKVIDALKRCSYDPDPGQPRKEIFSCSDCPYYRGCYHGCTYDLMRDALVLIKEQEDRIKGLLECATILSDALDEKEDGND